LLLGVRLDGLAVEAVARAKPLPQEPRLADPPSAIDDQQATRLGGCVELPLLALTVHKLERHLSWPASEN
jgi:hypothetical protein